MIWHPYTLHADDGGVADGTQLHVLDAFSGSVQPVVSNPAHVLLQVKQGSSDYSGSGTTIKVFQGAFFGLLVVGTSNGHWKVTIEIHQVLQKVQLLLQE